LFELGLKQLDREIVAERGHHVEAGGHETFHFHALIEDGVIDQLGEHEGVDHEALREEIDDHRRLGARRIIGV
jgi:hypothetical protein